MADKAWRTFAFVLALAGLLLGCAGPSLPPPPPPVAMAPLPSAHRGPQDVALEQALGDFYGAPYRSGGTTPQGVDCSGLIQALFQRAGVMLPRTVAQQYNAGRPVGPGELRFGDVVFFNRFCQTRGRDVFLAGLLPSFQCRGGLPRRHLPGGGPLHPCLPPGSRGQPPGRRNLARLL